LTETEKIIQIHIIMENVSAKKYSAIEMFNTRENLGQVKVNLPSEFFEKCKELFPTAESDEVVELKKNLNDLMFEKAQKKHKNYLRRQRAKQAKLSAQKEKAQEKEEAENITKKQEEQINSNKFETLSLSGSDSGVSVKSANSNIQKRKLNLPKTQKKSFTVVKTPEIMMTPEFVRKPAFSSGLNGNFRNQGKLRASTDDRSLIGSGSSSNNAVFAAKPVSEPRTWSNSRLNKKRQQQRGRIGSRS